jgi:hypothetical protein
MICPSCGHDHPRTWDLLTCAECGAELDEPTPTAAPVPEGPIITNVMPFRDFSPALQQAIARRNSINYGSNR